MAYFFEKMQVSIEAKLNCTNILKDILILYQFIDFQSKIDLVAHKGLLNLIYIMGKTFHKLKCEDDFKTNL